MRIRLLVLVFLFGLSAKAQERIVFESGKEGHAIYRIPAIISLPNNDLLAFAEGRVNGTDDFGDINLVMKRSTDDGKSWSEIQTLIDYDSLQAGNPAPVVDLHNPDFPDGVIYLFYNTGNNHEYEVRTGNGVREIWMIKSFDMGETWGAPVNITSQTHRPNQPEFNSEYNFEEDWRHYANTPGHAFQFQKGKFKGRIYIPANHSKGEINAKGEDYFAHGYYTDDHGETFHLSESVDIPGSNESIAAELPDSRMIMSIRNQKGDIRQRIIAYSEDGGVSWSEEYFDNSLVDPVCQGSILSFENEGGKTILAHSNNDHPSLRNNLTLKFSYDLGRTWKNPRVVDFNHSLQGGSWTAYSDLVYLGENKLGILYEKNDYQQIVFRAIQF